jgi:alpha-galactosidase
MTLPTKIVVIGAGSASFGENTLSALMRSDRLRGSTLALVDRNRRSLDIARRLADRINREWDSQFTLTVHAHHRAALEGAAFVISAIELGPREKLWRSDFEISLKLGVRQPYAENGGPGGFIHAARNIGPVMEIVRDMEQTCPEAWFINYTNPMMRICDAVNRHSKIKAVGLCHQIFTGYCLVGMVLGKDLEINIPEGITGLHTDLLQAPLREQVIHQVVPLVDIRAAGLNHFSWILSIRDRRTGEDLYPLFRQRWESFEPSFEPLTRRVFDAFGVFPIPGDTHLCEYLPWVSDPVTKPWEKYNIHLYDWDLWAGVRDFSLDRLEKMAKGELPIDSLRETDSEGALEMIENIAGAGTHYHLAANRPNEGQIPNLPLGAVVETPVLVNGAGIQPIPVGPLPEPIAELCRREITVTQLCVDSAVEGDRRKALQCLLLDPVIRDLDIAKQLLDEYLSFYKDQLPQFWKE